MQFRLIFYKDFQCVKDMVYSVDSKMKAYLYAESVMCQNGYDRFVLETPQEEQYSNY